METKTYIVCYQELSNLGKIVVKYETNSEEDAFKNLDTIALAHVKELEGEKHMAVTCQSTKTIDEIKNDTNLRNGLYLRLDNDIINVYEKKNITIPGIIYNSEECVVDKIALFCVTSFDKKIINQVVSTVSKNIPPPPPATPIIKKLERLSSDARSEDAQLVGQLLQLLSGKNTEDSTNNFKPSSLNYEKVTYKKPIKLTGQANKIVKSDNPDKIWKSKSVEVKPVQEKECDEDDYYLSDSNSNFYDENYVKPTEYVSMFRQYLGEMKRN